MLDWVLDRMDEADTRPALAVGDNVYTYRELLERVNEWSRRLRDRTVFGRVVSIEGEYGFETVAALIAAARFGNTLVPLSDACAAHHDKFRDIAEVEYRIRPADGDAAISWTGRDASHEFYVRLRQKDAPGLVLFSSGSTGRQKAAVHDLDGLLKKFQIRRHCYRTLVFLQLDHIGGINTLFYTIANGGMVVVADGRMPREVCRAIARRRVELLPTSPTFLNLLLLSEEHTRHDLSSLKLITYGTEPMPEITLKRVGAAFPGVKLLQTYGLSELGILRSQSRDDGSLWMRVGGEGFETRIVDNRLFIRAQSAMLGYLNAPSPFDADGFFDTGDLAEVDGEWIRIVGRHTEVINVGGNKVFPMEVENTLLALDGVDDVAVHGEPNPVTGQVVVASVTLSQDEDLAAFKTRMRVFLRDKLAAYKIPAKVQLVSTLHSTRFKKIRRAADPVAAAAAPVSSGASA
jgi:acyl-coenzyme A synthetase/AMP-(fatty) acid ligase